jgi:hypothetical protein
VTRRPFGDRLDRLERAVRPRPHGPAITDPAVIAVVAELADVIEFGDLLDQTDDRIALLTHEVHAAIPLTRRPDAEPHPSRALLDHLAALRSAYGRPGDIRLT